MGQVLRSHDPAGRTTDYQYNKNGDVTALTPPERPAHQFEYDSQGRMTQSMISFISIDDELGVEKSIGVVTTYHADESIEDVINFFVHSTVILDKVKGCMVAILNASDSGEMKMLRCLITS